jgi:uncharacterized protein (UPF0333 family)
MDNKAQAGLEYLMTYGWALVLLVTVVAVLFFLLGSAGKGVYVSSSNPTKILAKTANVNAGAQVMMQNATGGKITVNKVFAQGFTGCKMNNNTGSFEVGAGQQMEVKCNSSGIGSGKVTVNYTDFSGAQKTAVVKVMKDGKQLPDCPTGMVFIGELNGFCIDQYEESHSDATYCANSSQWNVCSASYGSSTIPASVAGRIPWTDITQINAQAACVAAGKRLCSNAEWTAAANLNGELYNLTNAFTESTCIVNAVSYCSFHSNSWGDGCNTGSNKDLLISNCTSSEGVYDLVGNATEWTSDVIDAGAGSVNDGWNYYTGDLATTWGNTVPQPYYGNDGIYTQAIKTSRGVQRGGYYHDNFAGGIFTMDLYMASTDSHQHTGFRCCK